MSLFESGRFQEAAIAFERVVYLTSRPDGQAYATLQKAECYKRLGRFAEAQVGLEQLNAGFLMDSLHYKVRYQAALCGYLAENWADANSQIVQMKHFIKDSALAGQSAHLEVLILNELAEWDLAKERALYMVEAKDLPSAIKDSLKGEILSYYSEDGTPKLKRKQKAENLSTYLPGLGQTYLGYPGEGALSVLMITGSLGFIGYSLFSQNYVTTFTVGSYFFQSFYYGGIRRTGFLADKKNYKIKRTFNDPVKVLILQIEGM